MQIADGVYQVQIPRYATAYMDASFWSHLQSTDPPTPKKLKLFAQYSHVFSRSTLVKGTPAMQFIEYLEMDYNDNYSSYCLSFVQKNNKAHELLFEPA